MHLWEVQEVAAELRRCESENRFREQELINKGCRRAQLCSRQKERKLSPLCYCSSAELYLVCSTGKAHPSKVCFSQDQTSCGDLERAMGKVERGLVLEDEMPQLLCP